MIRRPPRSTLSSSSAASDVYKRQHLDANVFDEASVQILLDITQKLGFKDDYEKASERVLNDLRKGKLGPFTLDLLDV